MESWQHGRPQKQGGLANVDRSKQLQQRQQQQRGNDEARRTSRRRRSVSAQMG
jgi:hypothetical protein